MQKLTTHDSVQDLSEQFADYFIQKIVTIQNGLCQNINIDNQCDETDVISNPATNEEISKIIRSSASKSCDLDHIPTWLLKLCLSELLPVITYTVNLSLSTSTVPYGHKLALITPLLKKVLLHPEVLKNFRPVSNRTYLSEIVERVVVVRLNQHLTKNGLHEVLHMNKTTALKQLCSKYKMIFLRQWTHMVEPSSFCLIYLQHLTLWTILYCCNDCMSWESEMLH